MYSTRLSLREFRTISKRFIKTTCVARNINVLIVYSLHYIYYIIFITEFLFDKTRKSHSMYLRATPPLYLSPLLLLHSIDDTI